MPLLHQLCVVCKILYIWQFVLLQRTLWFMHRSTLKITRKLFSSENIPNVLESYSIPSGSTEAKMYLNEKKTPNKYFIFNWWNECQTLRWKVTFVTYLKLLEDYFHFKVITMFCLKTLSLNFCWSYVWLMLHNLIRN